MDWELLIEAAHTARSHAYTPYSSFPVGAAVLTAEGEIHSGCNVENRTFGLTTCAERVAVTSAVAAGAKQIDAVVVVTDTDPPSTPCGLCLETLTEFGSPDLQVLLVNLNGDRKLHRLSELLPHPFQFPPR